MDDSKNKERKKKHREDLRVMNAQQLSHRRPAFPEAQPAAVHHEPNRQPQIPPTSQDPTSQNVENRMQNSKMPQTEDGRQKSGNPRSDSINKSVENLFLERFKIGEEIGVGSFGRVFKIQDVHTGEHFALKVEKVERHQNTLEREIKIYMEMQKKAKAVGMSKLSLVPQVHYFVRGDTHHGKNGKYYHQYLVMDLLGTTLLKLKEEAHGKLPWVTVSNIALQSITLLNRLHSLGYLHRDIKPDNMILGEPPYDGVIFLIDFGLSCKWDEPSGKHYLEKEATSSSSIVGTARYMSINVHKKRPYGWRDDLESLGYVLIYLLRGKLPWQGKKAETKFMQMNLILRSKEEHKETLCDDLPYPLAQYMKYCWELKHGDEPDYQALWDLFSS
jgi:serine/threonine protein kinase